MEGTYGEGSRERREGSEGARGGPCCDGMGCDQAISKLLVLAKIQLIWSEALERGMGWECLSGLSLQPHGPQHFRPTSRVRVGAVPGTAGFS